MTARDEKLSGGSGTEEVKTEKTQYELQQDIDRLEEHVATLKAEIRMPLTPGEVTVLKNVLSAEKVKLGDGDTVLMGLALIEKLNGYLNPELQLEDHGTSSIPLEGVTAE